MHVAPSRHTWAGSLAAVLLAAIAGMAGIADQAAADDSPRTVPTDCDRACFEALIDSYLEAVVARDPSRLPLSADVRYTENDQVLAIGDGFWNTAVGIGDYGMYVTDPVTNQAAWMGTVRERGGLMLMALRLRVQLGRITEIEKTFFRPGGGGPNAIGAMDARGTPDPVWLEAIPPAERASRHRLIETANAYFTGMENNDDRGFYPFTEDCDRYENGARTTNNPSASSTSGRFDYMGAGCKEQFESGYLAIVTRIHSRRYPLVDEERGIVWAYAILDLGGTVDTVTLTTGETVDMSAFAGRASSIQAAEAFKIENGLIRRIEMIGSSAPYHLNSAWGGLSGR